MKTVLQKRACSVESVQRQADNELDDELLQGKFETAQREALDDEELLQGKFSDTAQRAEAPLSTLNSPLSTNKTGIPDPMKAGFENLSGFSFDDVRVHYNSPKPAQLQALAYTQGSEVHIAPGQEKHLGHELGHVVQQKQGRVQPTMQQQGVNVNDNEGLEREADVIGRNAIQRKAISPSSNPSEGLALDQISVVSHAHKHDSDWPVGVDDDSKKRIVNKAKQVIKSGNFYNIPLKPDGTESTSAGKYYLGFTINGDGSVTINHFGPFGEGPSGTATQL